MTEPNILLVVIDDPWPRDYSAKEGANPFASLPFLNMVRDAGVYFPRCYTNPGCSSTRASLLTGLYPARHGIGENVPEEETFKLGLSQPSLLRMLSLRGYHVFVAGKWHLVGGSGPDTLTDPIDRGADEWFGPIRNPGDFWNWPAVKFGEIVEVPEYASEAITLEAFDMLTAVEGQGDPWFLWMAFTAAHEPFHVPPPRLHTQGQAGTDLEKWLASIEAVDSCLLDLWSRLSAETRANTLIMVLGDNGSPVDVTMAPQGFRKGTTGEGGVRNTLSVWHPQIPRKVSQGLIQVTDIYATLQDLVGDTNECPQDSISFKDRLDGGGQQAPDRTTVYCEKHEPNGFGPYSKRFRMARGPRYKLDLRDTGSGDEERMYDLATAQNWFDGDPLNLANLTQEQQDERARLRQVIEDSSTE